MPLVPWNDSSSRPLATRFVASVVSKVCASGSSAGLSVDTVKGPAQRKRLERDLLVDPTPESCVLSRA